MSSKDQRSSHSSRDSQTKPCISNPTSSKRSSCQQSKGPSHQITKGNNLSNDSSLGALTSTTPNNDQDNINNNHPTRPQIPYSHASRDFQDNNATTYAENILAGAASMGIDVPLHLQGAFVDMHGKSWPDFDLAMADGVFVGVDGSACEDTEVQEMESDSAFSGWSADSGAVQGDGLGGVLYGIGTQFEQ